MTKYILDTSDSWWTTIVQLSKEVPFGDLRKALDRIPELSILNNLDSLSEYLKDNKSAWGIYRCWLKVNESDKKELKKGQRLLKVMLNEPIPDDNTEHFKMALSRVGNISIWTSETLHGLHKLLISSNNPERLLDWDLLHNQMESTGKFPWNVLLATWCNLVNQQKLVATCEDISKLTSKEWRQKAKCLIAGTAIRNVAEYQEPNKMWLTAEWAYPGMADFAKSLLEDTPHPCTSLSEMLLTKAMSIQEKRDELAITKLTNDIEFTFEW